MGSSINIDLRPRSFDEVIGLKEQIATLRSKFDSGDVPRAVLLAGPFGTGKTTLAHILARYAQGWDFPAGMEPQVQEINSGNMTGVDAMRKLAESAELRPMYGRMGVIILDEAHKLSKPAQELLLKEFERENTSTLWIICTTDPEKLAKGIRAGRCFTITLKGMEPEEIKDLVARAAAHTKHTGDTTDFLAAVAKAHMVSPRKILQAFDSYHHGASAADAVAGQSLEGLPEYHEIAFAVVFGNWERDGTDWRDKSKTIISVAKQFQHLEERFAKKKADESNNSEDTGVVEEEDLESKPGASKAIRAIVGGFLKGRILKGGAKAETASLALDFLVHSVDMASFELEWAATIAAMYRINKKLNGGAK